MARKFKTIDGVKASRKTWNNLNKWATFAHCGHHWPLSRAGKELHKKLFS